MTAWTSTARCVRPSARPVALPRAQVHLPPRPRHLHALVNVCVLTPGAYCLHLRAQWHRRLLPVLQALGTITRTSLERGIIYHYGLAISAQWNAYVLTLWGPTFFTGLGACFLQLRVLWHRRHPGNPAHGDLSTTQPSEYRIAYQRSPRPATCRRAHPRAAPRCEVSSAFRWLCGHDVVAAARPPISPVLLPRSLAEPLLPSPLACSPAGRLLLFTPPSSPADFRPSSPAEFSRDPCAPRRYVTYLDCEIILSYGLCASTHSSRVSRSRARRRARLGEYVPHVMRGFRLRTLRLTHFIAL